MLFALFKVRFTSLRILINDVDPIFTFGSDDAEESLRWENDYLADKEVLEFHDNALYLAQLIMPEIAQLVTSKAVSLRLKAGSQEAGFLASFCPINKVPTLVVVKYV
jgi:hypothetical protein